MISKAHVIYVLKGDELGVSEEVRKLQENNKRLMKLFDGMKIFLSREAPRESLTFILRYVRLNFWLVLRWEYEFYITSAVSPENRESLQDCIHIY